MKTIKEYAYSHDTRIKLEEDEGFYPKFYSVSIYVQNNQIIEFDFCHNLQEAMEFYNLATVYADAGNYLS